MYKKGIIVTTNRFLAIICGIYFCLIKNFLDRYIKINRSGNKNIRIIKNKQGIQDVYLQVKAKESLKQKFDWLIQNSALVVQLIRQLKPIILEAFTNIKLMTAANKPKENTIKVVEPVKHDKMRQAIFLAYLKKLQTIAPVAILYINQLEYETAQIVRPAKKPYASAAEIREIAKNNNIIFINSAAYLVNQYFKTAKPPFGFHNKGLPGGHLNENGHIAISKALTDLISQVEAAKGMQR